MAYKSTFAGRAFAVRWLTPPDPHDLRTLGAEMVSHRKRVGEPLVSLSILPTDLSMPDAEARAEMEKFNKLWIETCEAIHVFVGGEGFKHSIFRSIVSALALATRKRGLVKVHRTLDEAFAHLAEAAPTDTAALRARLTESGMLAGL